MIPGDKDPIASLVESLKEQNRVRLELIDARKTLAASFKEQVRNQEAKLRLAHQALFHRSLSKPR